MLVVGSEGWPPFLVGIGAFAACGACLAVVLHRLPDLRGCNGDRWPTFAAIVSSVISASIRA